MVLGYTLLVVFLLLLNAIFALAEFAVVKIRASRVDELVSQGDPRSQALQHVKERLDEYLSVCQVGVTLSSIGLGFVAPTRTEVVELGEPDILGWSVRDGSLFATFGGLWRTICSKHSASGIRGHQALSIKGTGGAASPLGVSSKQRELP